jgi:hypothetical protein
MSVLGRGSGGTLVRIGGGREYMTVKLSQVLSMADVQIAFSSWILGRGVFPADYNVEDVSC